MTRTLFNIEPLVPLIEAGKLILTPNNRLRNNIHLAYCTYAESGNGGNTVVASPRVLSLREWQTTTWQRLQDLGYKASLRSLADSSISDILWQQVLEEAGIEQTGVRSILECRALAKQAKEAHATLLAWLYPHAAQGSDIDAELGLWCEAFERKLDQHGMINQEMAQAVLAQAFADGVLKQEDEIYLHSFVDITPLNQQLLASASKQQHSLQSSNAAVQTRVRTVAENQSEEFTQAANWAWNLLQQQPEATIAIISPQLARDRDILERHFCEVFESHSYDPQQLRAALPFNISAAQTLGKTQLIASTLQLLELNRQQLSLDQAVVILNSPFFGRPQTEIALRAQITERLKNKGSFTCSPSDIAQAANEICEQHARQSEELNQQQDEELKHWQQWTKALFQFIELRRRQKKSLYPGQWVEVFMQQLQAIGWPGDRRVDSVEFQQLKHWYLLLEDFAGFDCLATTFSLEQALSRLKELANDTPFQTETRDTPIHIVGAFEAVGLQFSHCWILGLNDKEWPSSLRPNPLLPRRLQYLQKMPKASLEREIELAQTLSHHFLQTAPHCVVSYSRQHGHGQVNDSPLVRHLDFRDLASVVTSTDIGLATIFKDLKTESKTEWVNCETGPPLLSSIENPARGGQNIFKQQALCPFNAFAQLRLHAYQTDPPSLGLTPQEKGTVIHEALAALWEQLGEQENLLALTEGQLANKIKDVLDDCFHQVKKKDLLVLGDYYYQLEQQRMTTLLSNWLNMEKLRPPFRVIGTEQELKTEYQGIHLSMRIDRIDQLDSGEILLFDYKTSAQTPSTWLQERPAEPQLPLYSLCYPTAIAGISFAIVNSQDLGFRGISDNADDLHITGIKSSLAAAKIESWSQLKNEFQDRLSLLAKEIVNGDSQVFFQSSQHQQDRDKLASLNRYAEVDYIHYRWKQQL